MSLPEWPEAIKAYQETLHAVVRGDPEPTKRLWSRRDDVTLANPLGPPVRGWSQVEQALDRAVSQLRDGEPMEFEPISEYATEDLGLVLWIERTRAKLRASEALTP